MARGTTPSTGQEMQSHAGMPQKMPDATERIQRAAGILARAAIRACLANAGLRTGGDGTAEHGTFE